MIVVQNLWTGTSWDLQDEDAAWRWAQDHLPQVFLKHPRTFEDLLRAVNGHQNLIMTRQGHPDVDDHGPPPAVAGVFQAARLLQEGRLAEAPHRAARVAFEDDPRAAALAACGLDPSPDNLQALEGLLQLSEPLGKAEAAPEHGPPPDGAVAHPFPEGQAFADAVRRAVQGGHLSVPLLGGKPQHSAGTWLAEDPQDGKRYLLKPGSGRTSPAAGVAEEPASQTRREVACWQALDAMGLGGVAPEAQLVTVGGREYAVELWLGSGYAPMADAYREDPAGVMAALAPHLRDGLVHTLAAALYVLGDADGHGDNFLIEDGQFRAIDFGSACAGYSFDPGHDPNSFTPWILRIFAGEDYARLSPELRCEKLPRISFDLADQIAAWLADLADEQTVLHVLSRYGILQGPAADRLYRLAEACSAGAADLSVNEAWTVGL